MNGMFVHVTRVKYRKQLLEKRSRRRRGGKNVWMDRTGNHAWPPTVANHHNVRSADRYDLLAPQCLPTFMVHQRDGKLIKIVNSEYSTKSLEICRSHRGEVLTSDVCRQNSRYIVFETLKARRSVVVQTSRRVYAGCHWRFSCTLNTRLVRKKVILLSVLKFVCNESPAPQYSRTAAQRNSSGIFVFVEKKKYILTKTPGIHTLSARTHWSSV